MKFEMTGRLVFEAANITEAFDLLAKHFTALANGEESNLAETGTSVMIKPAGRPTVPPSNAKKTRRRRAPRRKG